MYLLKSHVSATSYVNEHGTAVNRRKHEDSRTSALEGLRSHPDHRVRSYARKILGSKDSYDLHQIRRERFGHLPHWNKLDDHTRHAIVDAEEEKAKSHKEFEDWVETHGSKKGKKKDAEKVDRSGWEQQLMFKARRVQHVAYILRKSTTPVSGYITGKGKLVSNYTQNRILQSAAPFKHTLVRFMEQIAAKRNLPEEQLTKEALFAAHGNELKAVGEINPKIVQDLGLTDNHIYTSEGYFLDHHFNHHPNLPIIMYMTIPDVLMHPDRVVKDPRFDRQEVYAFVRKYDRHHTVVIDAAKVNGQLVIYKTFFSQKKMPYKGLPVAWQKSLKGREDYISSIDPDALVSTPGGSRFSALLPSSETIISLPENKFNKSHNPLHLIRRRGC